MDEERKAYKESTTLVDFDAVFEKSGSCVNNKNKSVNEYKKLVTASSGSGIFDQVLIFLGDEIENPKTGLCTTRTVMNHYYEENQTQYGVDISGLFDLGESSIVVVKENFKIAMDDKNTRFFYLRYVGEGIYYRFVPLKKES